MDREIKIDLFEVSDKQKPKKRFKYSFKRLFPCGFINFRLSYEGAIFSLIILLMFCVIIFSLGIERGRHSSANNTMQTKLTHTQAVIPAANVLPPEPVKESTVKYNYTIQILTYRDRPLAERQLQKLIKEGYKPFIIYTSGFYQICVGKYTTKETARNDLSALRKIYKDCFIRRIP